MRSQSKARARQMRFYRAQRTAFLVRHPWCVCHGLIPVKCQPLATEIHHARGRVNALLLDERFWLPVCATAHRWITEHVTEARALGLFCECGFYNTVERTGRPAGLLVTRFERG